jgi:predicted nucleic acid-binding protein
MSKVFLDTNILVYSLDQSDIGKRGKCRRLLKSLVGESSGVISTQVMQEFFMAATTKLGADPLLLRIS